MTRKEKLTLILLLFLLLALPIILLLLKQRQEKRLKAAGCVIAFDTAFLPQDRWQQVDNRYQILASDSAQNKFKMNWTCDVNIASFQVKNGTSDISDKCKTNLFQNPECGKTVGAGCVIPNIKSGSVSCQNLEAALYNISFVFTPQ